MSKMPYEQIFCSGSEADTLQRGADVRFVPKPDMAGEAVTPQVSRPLWYKWLSHYVL